MDNQIHCLIVDDEPVAREILENHLGRIDRLKLVGSCQDAIMAFKVINTEPVDLIFLDINMPDISGLSFARSLTKNIKVIFTTAYREYAVEGFDLQAVDYLLKPISYERLLQSVSKFRKETDPVPLSPGREMNDGHTDAFFVRSDRKMVKIDIPGIIYIESISDYIKIRMEHRSVVTRETLSGIEQKLPEDSFLKIHRSFIVSIPKIDSYTHESVLINGKELPISRGQKEAVLHRLSNK